MDRVVGLDLSLTGSGVSDGLEAWTYGEDGKKAWSQRRRAQRVHWVADQVLGQTMQGGAPRLVLIEWASLRSTGNAVDELSGLRWTVRHELRSAGVPVAVLSPQTRAVYACGNGRAKKQQVLAAARRRWPTVDLDNDNEGDALVLAAMGHHQLGQRLDGPDDTLFGAHSYMLRALAAVDWPPGFEQLQVQP